MVGRFAGRPRPTRADKTLRFPLWVGRGRPSGDPPAGQTHKHTNTQSTLRRRRLPLPNALRNEISRSGALTLIYIYIYTSGDLSIPSTSDGRTGGTDGGRTDGREGRTGDGRTGGTDGGGSGALKPAKHPTHFYL